MAVLLNERPHRQGKVRRERKIRRERKKNPHAALVLMKIAKSPKVPLVAAFRFAWREATSRRLGFAFCMPIVIEGGSL